MLNMFWIVKNSYFRSWKKGYLSSYILCMLICIGGYGQALLAQTNDGQGDWRTNPELANYLSKKAGARIHSASSTDSSSQYFVGNIIDPSKGEKGIWRTAPKKKPPQWVVIELPEVRTLTTFMVNMEHTNEKDYRGVSARVLKVEFSNIGPTEGFRRVGKEYLKKKKNLQIVSVEAAKARWVRLVIEANWDFPIFAELGRVYAYNDVVMNRYESEISATGELTVEDIHFDVDSDRLLEKSNPIIESVAVALHNHPEWQVIVEGHTDSTGSPDYNRELSFNRAISVIHALENAGIDPNRLEAVGKGSSEPVTEGDTVGERRENRRVVFKLKSE